MKKLISLLLVLMLCLSLVPAVFAEEAAPAEEPAAELETVTEEEPSNVAEEIFTEGPMVENETKAYLSAGDLIRFIPVVIDVTKSYVEVQGYFVNMNSNITISDFTNFEMDIYQGGDFIISGYFGKINSFSVYPLSAKYQSFTFTGDYTYGLNTGSYTCDDLTCAAVGFSFSSR